MGFSLKGLSAGIGGAVTGALGVWPGLLGRDGGGSGSGGGQGVGYDPAREAAIKARIAGLQTNLDKLAPPKMLGAEGPAYQAKKLEGPLPEYNAIRARVANQANAAGQTQSDALTRRFAAMGGAGNGAFIKNQQQVLQDAEAAKAEQLSQVDSQEAQARREMQMAEDDKQFQSEEALKGRSLAREQFNADADFKDKVFRFDSTSKLAQLEMGFVQADRDAQDQAFNKQMALYQQQHSGGLFGAGGTLGLGF